jgi:hypothetical protein
MKINKELSKLCREPQVTVACPQVPHCLEAHYQADSVLYETSPYMRHELLKRLSIK